MARRIASRKRKHYGNRTFGGGNTKNRRGKGNRGGVGRAGFHKHKWLQTINAGEHKKRKYGFHTHSLVTTTVTLDMLSKTKEAKVVLAHARVVATGELTKPLEVHAYGFSAAAKQAIEKAGGKAITLARPKAEKKPAAGKKE